MKAKIKKVIDANETFYYFIITRPNHTDIFSKNYKSESVARIKLNKKLEELGYTKINI